MKNIFDFLYDLSVVFWGALLGTIAGKTILFLVKVIIDALVK